MTYWDKTTIERIRRGYYSAIYFNRTKQILEREQDETVVTMQVFQWNDESVLCGIDEVVELLRIGTAKQNALRVFALHDGDIIGSRESVMHITGPYVYFAHFEKEHTPVDGYGVGSALVHGANDFTADVVKVNGKKIAKVGRIYMPNRRLRPVAL